MAFKNNCVCTLWNNKQTGKVVTEYDGKIYADIQISTSKKNKNTEKYENDFVGTVRCFGKAKEKLLEVVLKEKDKVKLLEVETSNHYDATRKQTYYSFVCWDLEIVEQENKRPKEPQIVDNGAMPSLDDLTDTLPF